MSSKIVSATGGDFAGAGATGSWESKEAGPGRGFINPTSVNTPGAGRGLVNPPNVAPTNAFVHALEFAKIVQAELVLLHSFDLPVFDNQFFLKITRLFMILWSCLNLKYSNMKFQSCAL